MDDRRPLLASASTALPYGGVDAAKLAVDEASGANVDRADATIAGTKTTCAAPRVSCGCVVGNFFVVLSQILTVANEVQMQYQETNAHPYLHPYFSVWFDHSATGLVAAVVALVWLLATKQSCLGVLRGAGFTGFWGAFWVSLVFAVGFMFNVFWSASLPLVTVALFATLSQTSCVFVMLISAAVLKHKVTWLEIAATVFCLAGVAVVSFVDPAGSGGGGGSGGTNITTETAVTGMTTETAVTSNVNESTAAVNAFRGFGEAPTKSSLIGIAFVMAYSVGQAAYVCQSE
jgi:hypothetical protein